MAADVLQQQFTQIHNVLFRDTRLSYKAKGLFGLISTHRDGFGISEEALTSFSTDGLAAVRTGLRELIEYGYLQRVRSRDAQGRLGPAEYHITDMPEGLSVAVAPSVDPISGEEAGEPESSRSSPTCGNLNQEPESQSSRSEPTCDSPRLGFPTLENQPHKKTTSFKKTKEKKTNNTSAPSRDADPATSRPDIERVCTHLADRIEANGSKRPTITKSWRTAARLLLDKDGRTEDQVHTAIDWCQDSEFWRANVLSMPKLRDKYDQLRLQAQRQSGGNVVPLRGQQQTDDLFDRAMTRAHARMSTDTPPDSPTADPLAPKEITAR